MPKLLRLGFICCKYYSPEAQALELWHLINPKLEESLSKDVISGFLSDLAYIAVDMNLSMFLFINLHSRSLEKW